VSNKTSTELKVHVVKLDKMWVMYHFNSFISGYGSASPWL